jgi:CelD/BcsL family acetyltransferase involved in cellulose biosynthesis
MIRTVDPRTDPAWRELMLSDRGSLFGAPPWLSAICDTYGFDMSANLTLDANGQPTGGFAFAEVDDFLGPRLLSLPFCDFLDPIVDTDEQWHEIVDPLIERGLTYQIRVINADEPRRDERFVEVDEMAWHATDLTSDEDAMFAAWSRTARQNVRSAQKNGVTVRFGSDLEDVHAFHELHRRTRKHKHRLLAQPVSFFENIWKQFAPDDSIVCGFAEHEGEVIAGSMYLMWGGVWFYKFSASIFARSGVRPNEILAWESMCLAKSRGCPTYDWGVSDLDPPGLVEYKRKIATGERKVSVLRYTPEGYANPVAAEARPVLGELTKLLTREDIPDDITQRAGEILYRYFT